MKKLLTVAFLFFTFYSQSQSFIKINAVSALVAIPNIGYETSIGKKSTLQFDFLVSFWESVGNLPLQFISFTPEYRYHFHEKYNGFYVGVNAGGAAFDVSKGGHRAANQHEKGFGYFIGATIGYEKKINDKIMLDFFIGGGNFQSFYKAYDMNTNERYDLANNYNKSGESLPYRGGIMISYKIK